MRKRRLQDTNSDCVKSRRGAMKAWAMLAGEGLKKSLLPLRASSAACCVCCSRCCCSKRVHTRCRMMYRAYRQPEVALAQTGKKSGLRHSRGKLGQSEASGEFLSNRMQRSNINPPIHGFIMMCLPNMTNGPIISKIVLGFVISRR